MRTWQQKGSWSKRLVVPTPTLAPPGWIVSQLQKPPKIPRSGKCIQRIAEFLLKCGSITAHEGTFTISFTWPRLWSERHIPVNPHKHLRSLLWGRCTKGSNLLRQWDESPRIIQNDSSQLCLRGVTVVSALIYKWILIPHGRINKHKSYMIYMMRTLFPLILFWQSTMKALEQIIASGELQQ